MNDFGQSCPHPFEGLQYWCGHGSKYLPFNAPPLRQRPRHLSLDFGPAIGRPPHGYIVIISRLFTLHCSASENSEFDCLIVQASTPNAMLEKQKDQNCDGGAEKQGRLQMASSLYRLCLQTSSALLCFSN